MKTMYLHYYIAYIFLWHTDCQLLYCPSTTTMLLRCKFMAQHSTSEHISTMQLVVMQLPKQSQSFFF